MQWIEKQLGIFPLGTIEWEQGLHLDEYILGMKKNQAEMRQRKDRILLSQPECSRISQVNRPVKIACLSEDWCVDCLMTLPIMNRIAACASNMELRIFSRERWQILKAYFNQRGIMAVPAYAFLDPDLHEFATFVERPQPVYARVTEWKAAHPEMEEIRLSATISSEEKSARLAEYRAQLQAAMEAWYEESCQSAMVAEVAALLGV